MYFYDECLIVHLNKMKVALIDLCKRYFKHKIFFTINLHYKKALKLEAVLNIYLYRLL